MVHINQIHPDWEPTHKTTFPNPTRKTTTFFFSDLKSSGWCVFFHVYKNNSGWCPWTTRPKRKCGSSSFIFTHPPEDKKQKQNKKTDPSIKWLPTSQTWLTFDSTQALLSVSVNLSHRDQRKIAVVSQPLVNDTKITNLREVYKKRQKKNSKIHNPWKKPN